MTDMHIISRLLKNRVLILRKVLCIMPLCTNIINIADTILFSKMKKAIKNL